MQEYLEQHIGVKTRRQVLYQGYVEGISATGMQSNHVFDGQQQGVGLKGLAKSSVATEEVPPLLEENGKIEVWRINGNAKTTVPKEDIGKFYSGDCYIVLYTYHSNEKKEDYYLCCWIGKDSIEAGLSSGYKNSIADKELNDETYTLDGVALIQISGTSPHNNKAVQVDVVATSLNTSECFLLQFGSSLFTWHGNQSSVEQHSIAAKIAEFLKVTVPCQLPTRQVSQQRLSGESTHSCQVCLCGLPGVLVWYLIAKKTTTDSQPPKTAAPLPLIWVHINRWVLGDHLQLHEIWFLTMITTEMKMKHI
ncbi:unnamed protein product [Lactuca saligna]|uniref:Gelsolin-like domain-containing protein n=1 Tax=Lactuca saligna TaxID=75948 RepID=A0AA35Y982_LACSI|nr:unnamed protein product [Lactuca saligna]